MLINQHRNYCYRICHIGNLPHLLSVGLCTKHHTHADKNFIPIGNTEIINSRDTCLVRIPDYGYIGEYVPFYLHYHVPVAGIESIIVFNLEAGYFF